MKKTIAFVVVMICLALAVSTSALSASHLSDRQAQVKIAADSNSYLRLLIDNSQQIIQGEDNQVEVFAFTNQGSSSLDSIQLNCIQNCQGVVEVTDIGPLSLGQQAKSSVIFTDGVHPGLHEMVIEIKAQWSHALVLMDRMVRVNVYLPTPPPPELKDGG